VQIGPKVSIITAVFNAEKTILGALRSVQYQTYKNIEHLIIDGASTDRTLSIIEDNASESIILKSEADAGIYDALNKGIAITTGEIVGILHSDDEYGDSRTLEMVVKLFSDPSVDVVYGNLNYVSRINISKVVRCWRAAPFVEISSGVYSEELSMFKGWMPPHPTLFIRKSCYLSLGGFDTQYKISSDYDFIWRLFFKSQYKAVYLDAVIVKMRLGGVSNQSFLNILKKSHEDWRILRSLKIGFLHALRILVCKNLSKIPQFLVS
jgi:glycosyltransferase